MKCELLAEQNLALMLDFIDDENTKYDEAVLKAFIHEKNAYGYIAADNGRKKSTKYPPNQRPFAQWSLRVLGADSALPFALTNSSRFLLRRTAHWADASLVCPLDVFMSRRR